MIKLINKKKFAKVALDENFKTFVVYVVLAEVETLIHSLQTTQITTLQWNKAPTQILIKYSDYADVSLFDLTIKLPENTSINEHTIKFVNEK